MPLVWRYGRAWTCVEDGDPDGRPVCLAPGTTPPQFSATERWERLQWTVDGRFASALAIRGEISGRKVVDVILHAPEFTFDDHAKPIVEAIRTILTPLPAGFTGQRPFRDHRWVELVDSRPLDRCSPNHHVWPAHSYRDEDFCLCGRRKLIEARRDDVVRASTLREER